MEIIQATVVVVLGTFFLAVGIAGYFRKALSVWERCAFFAAAVCLILPSTITDWIGLAIGVAACAYCFATVKRVKAAARHAKKPAAVISAAGFFENTT